MNIEDIVCVIVRIICKCSKAGCNTTVSTIKNKNILVHFLKDGKRKSITSTMNEEIMTTMKLDRTVPSMDSSIGIIDTSSNHLMISLDSVSISNDNCGSQSDRMAILIANCAIDAIDS